MTERKWRKLNFGLLALIIGVNLYTIALPWLPSLQYTFQTKNDPATKYTVGQFVAKQPEQTPGNRLIIPRLLIDTQIVDGPLNDSYNLLNKGAWHLPFSPTPDTPGNVVIAGHRFSYTGPRGIFYELDKLQIGDEIGLRWNDSLYTYKVESSRTHAATDVYIQQPTSDTRLTLYTCTPLWNPVNRLVIVAKPIKEAP